MKFTESNAFINVNLKNKDEVFNFIKDLNEKNNYADEKLVDSMKARDKTSTVAIGNYLAIPHCEYEYATSIKNNSFIFIKLKKKINWDGHDVLFVIALILNDNDQIDALEEIALSFSDEDNVLKFYKNCNSVEQINEFIEKQGEI
ncbi:PTS system, mannitol-specific IIA component [Spiroplasma chinense]|uniref:PTS system, mannitol-specific IIA component n=1 Tax=Spiroplasma chinense TaxID=216932 RepID=A0A5B9Y5D1_9MOLU|nr:PTS sugar transporter subunit IIA [Spiroplasma chinense]QEH62160.1 PTS system, mannitol-specific IIA component [Spiroplasma chinense]